MKVIIIGGGASGLACALKLGKLGIDTTILEKNARCGKKLLLTGNGKCNIGNKDMSDNHFHTLFTDEKNLSDMSNFLNEFYDDLGVLLKDKNGYLYPNSNQAETVVTSLVNNCLNYGVKIINDCEVLNINKENNYVVESSKGVYKADYVVIATGGLSYPGTGSTGFGYDYAKKINHNLVELKPGLVALNIKEKLADWDGVRIDATVSLFDNDKLIREEFGELQLTKNGISGIAVFQISSLYNRMKNAKVKINFLPAFNDNKLLEKYLNKNETINIKNNLYKVLNTKLVNVLLDYLKINGNELSSKKNMKVIIDKFMNFRVTIDSDKGFLFSQTTIGGVSLNELTSNFESKLCPNLFFIGETIDLDGDCGGYNLSLAFFEGYKVGSYVKSKTN